MSDRSFLGTNVSRKRLEGAGTSIRSHENSFTKAHGAKNDFLMTWEADRPLGNPANFARNICDRRTGVGADGWMVVKPGGTDADGAIALYNSDGSVAEVSGNGTRCAAALLIVHGYAAGSVRVLTPRRFRCMRMLHWPT